MIRFFNVNNPSVALFLFVYVVVLNLVLFIHPALFSLEETHAPLSHFFFRLTEILFNNNHYVLSALSIIIVFIQALLFSNIVNNTRLFFSISYVPAIIYVTIASLFTEFLFLSPELLSLTFIIPALNKTLNFYKNHHCASDIFDMGLLTALASLFYMPSFLLVILMFLALFIMRTFNWREWLIGLSGFLVVYFLTGTYFFLTDGLMNFIQQHILSASIETGTIIESAVSLGVVGGFTGALTIAALLMLLFNFLKSPVQARKFLVIAGWMFVLLCLSALFVQRLTLGHFVLLGVPLSLGITYLFMNIRRPKIANFLHLVWLVLVLFFQYYRT